MVECGFRKRARGTCCGFVDFEVLARQQLALVLQEAIGVITPPFEIRASAQSQISAYPHSSYLIKVEIRKKGFQ